MNKESLAELGFVPIHFSELVRLVRIENVAVNLMLTLTDLCLPRKDATPSTAALVQIVCHGPEVGGIVQGALEELSKACDIPTLQKNLLIHPKDRPVQH